MCVKVGNNMKENQLETLEKKHKIHILFICEGERFPLCSNANIKKICIYTKEKMTYKQVINGNKDFSPSLLIEEGMSLIELTSFLTCLREGEVSIINRLFFGEMSYVQNQAFVTKLMDLQPILYNRRIYLRYYLEKLQLLLDNIKLKSFSLTDYEQIIRYFQICLWCERFETMPPRIPHTISSERNKWLVEWEDEIKCAETTNKLEIAKNEYYHHMALHELSRLNTLLPTIPRKKFGEREITQKLDSLFQLVI